MENNLTTTSASPAPADHEKYKRMFAEFLSATSEARQEALVDIDLYDGNHLTAAERLVLKRRGQPDNVFNMTRLAVNGTLGVIKQGSTDPRAFPRNPGVDEDSADVASKTLRFIADKNHFDALRIDAAKDYLVPGICAAIVEVDDDNLPAVEQIRWEEFVYDPHSRRQDFRDARYLGVARWQYADDVAADYPEAATDIEACVNDTSFGMVDASFSDRPQSGVTFGWSDLKNRRVLVVELYHRERGQWRRCVFHGNGVLEEGESPYLDEKGRPCCPIVAQSCYVDRDNNRTGTVRDMRGPQSEINKRHSKLLHILNTRQIQPNPNGPPPEVDIETARKEAARPDGVIPPGYMVVPTADMARGQAELLQEAKAFLERFAPNPAMLGRQGADKSGRAKQIDQQAGMTELAIVFGGIEEWELRVYREMWRRARQFMTAPDFIRITDDEGSPQFIGINQPVMGSRPVVQYDPMRGGFRVDQEPVVLGYENALAELDVDIVLDTVPDTANLQAEQFNVLAELAKMFPKDVTFDDVLEVSSMPNKRQIIERRKARMSQPPPPPNPMEEAEIKNKNADTEVKLSTAYRNVHQAAAPRLPAPMPPPGR